MQYNMEERDCIVHELIKIEEINVAELYSSGCDEMWISNDIYVRIMF
jgi:hypothetical protein